MTPVLINEACIIDEILSDNFLPSLWTASVISLFDLIIATRHMPSFVDMITGDKSCFKIIFQGKYQNSNMRGISFYAYEKMYD